MIPAFTEALVRELQLWAPEVRGRAVPTVFFGGGTPSLLPLAALERILSTIAAEFRLEAQAEVTLEANPGTVDQDYLRGLRMLGVNRLSLGVQSLDDSELRMLDRIHSAEAAVQAYSDARAAGFKNVNLDLIFGVSGQSLDGWERSLGGAIALGPEHLSLYALTVEEGTGLAAQIERGLVPAPDPDAQAEMYERTQDRMAAAGYEHYEISNWCRPGYECRHNLTYWLDGDWLGVGPGAHSHLGGQRFAVVRSPGAYIRAVPEGERREATAAERMTQVASWEAPDGATERADAAMLALRLTRGLHHDRFGRRFGARPDRLFAETFRECAALGLVESGAGVTRLTRRGRLFSNEVFVRILVEARAAESPGGEAVQLGDR
jgi:oxygen-independent coproporphyrinogen-3 oxidase